MAIFTNNFNQEWGYKPVLEVVFSYKTVVLYDCKNKLNEVIINVGN